MTGGAEINLVGAREVCLCEFEQGEDQKTRSSVQKFPQILVMVSKFLRYSTNSQMKTKKKGLRSKSFMKFGVSPQKLRKYGR